jgi:hypothetical protein
VIFQETVRKEGSSARPGERVCALHHQTQTVSDRQQSHTPKDFISIIVSLA